MYQLFEMDSFEIHPTQKFSGTKHLVRKNTPSPEYVLLLYLILRLYVYRHAEDSTHTLLLQTMRLQITIILPKQGFETYRISRCISYEVLGYTK